MKIPEEPTVPTVPTNLFCPTDRFLAPADFDGDPPVFAGEKDRLPYVRALFNVLLHMGRTVIVGEADARFVTAYLMGELKEHWDVERRVEWPHTGQVTFLFTPKPAPEPQEDNIELPLARTKETPPAVTAKAA